MVKRNVPYIIIAAIDQYILRRSAGGAEQLLPCLAVVVAVKDTIAAQERSERGATDHAIKLFSGTVVPFVFMARPFILHYAVNRVYLLGCRGFFP